MRRFFPLLAALALAASGCAFLKALFATAFKTPTLTFKSFQLTDVSFSGARVNLVWALENPNPIGISLAEVDYAFFVEGKQVVAGRPPAGLQVPATGRSDLVFPANVKFADVASVVQTFLTQDSARYRAEGHLGLQTPLGVLKLPLSKDGQFEVPKLPAIQLSTPRVTRMTLREATVELPLSVTNRNTFALPVNRVSGHVQIAGVNVGELTTGDLGQLPGKATQEVTLPLTLHFAQAAAAAAALRAGAATVGFTGQVQSGASSLPFALSQNLSFAR